ncbi:glycosyl transferase family 2 [Candidatus Omnitrophus magneticus]|uniref:Glycosyl transferase family 2 n=1 Tax=Candidatus Omnitrophus magneticus TaxID=1609969 RepID=A0A0F0CQV2_9BACT|nr:glycosyl transferase family 2 [Candidatus Omnitrophus magneticus]
MEANTNNTIVLIPSYNEAKTIRALVETIKKMRLSVLVVDDGSTDATEKEARASGAIVLRNEKNQGKGASIKLGLIYIFNKTNYEWVVFMDGDAQHDPRDIISLMNASSSNNADMVIGNRMGETKNMPRPRYYTNIFTSWIVSSLCGQKIDDSQCGYRIIKTEFLKKMSLLSERYDIESEMLFEAARNKARIISSPVRTIYGDEVSKIRPFRDTIKFFKMVFTQLVKKLKER